MLDMALDYIRDLQEQVKVLLSFEFPLCGLYSFDDLTFCLLWDLVEVIQEQS